MINTKKKTITYKSNFMINPKYFLVNFLSTSFTTECQTPICLGSLFILYMNTLTGSPSIKPRGWCETFLFELGSKVVNARSALHIIEVLLPEVETLILNIIHLLCKHTCKHTGCDIKLLDKFNVFFNN